MAKAYKLGNEPLFCHAFNANMTEMALSANSNIVQIFSVPSKPNDTFKLLDTLTDHTSTVTGIDWAAKTDRLVTCSADRNAYVWTRTDGAKKWKPALVILQINRAAVCVRWSPLENKFAVGSGSRSVAVCYFAQENDWWVGKHIKKPIRSTITCLDWHPNNALIACGSTDFKARVFSAYIKNVDEKPEETPWGKKMTFQNLMYEADNSAGGWVHSIGFSSDGNKLAWVAHDSSICVAHASPGGGDQPNVVVTSIRGPDLPFTTLLWLGPTAIVTAGHNCCPMLYHFKGDNQLIYDQELDVKTEAKIGKINAMKKFQDIDRKATSDDTGTKLNTLHQNTITEIRFNKGRRERVDQVSSIGRDGQLIFWDLRTLEQRIDALKIA